MRSTSNFSAFARWTTIFAVALAGLATTGCAASVEADGEPETTQQALAQGPVTSQWSNGACTIFVGGGAYTIASAQTQYQCAYAGWWSNAAPEDQGVFTSPCNKFHWACASN